LNVPSSLTVWAHGIDAAGDMARTLGVSLMPGGR
jgi:hypothetical protein